LFAGDIIRFDQILAEPDIDILSIQVPAMAQTYNHLVAFSHGIFNVFLEPSGLLPFGEPFPDQTRDSFASPAHLVFEIELLTVRQSGQNLLHND